MKSSFSDSGNFETLEIQEIYYAHARQKLTLLHLFTGLFRKEICPHSSEYLQVILTCQNICKVITLQIF